MNMEEGSDRAQTVVSRPFLVAVSPAPVVVVATTIVAVVFATAVVVLDDATRAVPSL